MFPKVLRSTLAHLLIISLMGAPLLSQDQAQPQPQGKSADLRKLAKQIESRDRDQNGILVGQPKVYDDSLLQQMLNTAEARLMSLQILDQTGIASKLGSITGASQTISSFGLSLQ